jgi:5-methylcytosine-specific restriction endonuclease McrA
MATTLNSLFNTLRGFSEEQKQISWSKAQIVPGRDPNVIRKDACGAWIKWSDYGDTNSEWGWEIDHIHPVSRGGTDHPNNLQALHWQNNRAKGDLIAGFVPAIVAVQ